MVSLTKTGRGKARQPWGNSVGSDDIENATKDVAKADASTYVI